jgi:sec-independent protein translocase protein TatA
MTGLLSPVHIVVLLVVLLLVFGAKRLPELGRELGTGLREFKHSVGAEPGEQRATLAAAPEPAAQPAGATPVAVTAADAIDAPAARPAA